MLHSLARATFVALLVGTVSTLGAFAPAQASARVPKVVLIVGPVGDLTAGYRVQADMAAGIAEAAGAQVVRVYSPNATWPMVQQAVQGASIVVYLGHGNGWPSRYRDKLFPPTQDGFGLNPVAGVDDDAHQYFGEAFVETLQLAPDAVVLLHHLCYASGNSEPGLPEGTRAQAVQRADNYATGFLRAGAQAVVAEGHLGPAYYVGALLTGQLSIKEIWQRSPSTHGHVFAVASERSPGYTTSLDPDTASGGYFRSVVSAGLVAAAVRAGGTGSSGSTIAGPPAQPSLASLGLRFGDPSLGALPIAGTTTGLTLPLAASDLARIPRGVQVGVRWDSILVDPPADVSPGAAPAPSVSPGAAPEAPAVELVVAERAGSVVTPARAVATSAGLAIKVAYPAVPGLYRLVPTLHAPSGVAFDAATQALLTPVIVRVGGPIAVGYGAAPSLDIEAGAARTLAVRVANVGAEAWDDGAAMPSSPAPEDLLVWLRTSRVPAHLVATWVSAAGLPVPGPVTAVLDPSVFAPGGGAGIDLELVAPVDPGEYLLLLDVLSPSHGPVSALGSAPAIVRVTVSAALLPAPVPTLPVERYGNP